MAPDPRRVRSECLSPVKDDLLVDENDSDDDINTNPEGYTLFTGEIADIIGHGYSSDSTDGDEYEENELETSGADEDNSDICMQDNENSVCSETDEQIKQDCDTNRSDIAIDCDKIKAAMVGFTLPPSSIPAWASGISDLDMSSHIERILNDKK